MRDYKHYRAPEEVHLTRKSTYLIIAALLAVIAWMTERDNQYATWYQLKESSNHSVEVNHEPNS